MRVTLKSTVNGLREARAETVARRSGFVPSFSSLTLHRSGHFPHRSFMTSGQPVFIGDSSAVDPASARKSFWAELTNTSMVRSHIGFRSFKFGTYGVLTALSISLQRQRKTPSAGVILLI